MNDCIQKAEALEAIKALPADLDAEAIQRAIEAVNAIPAADVIPGRWIPVTERLPEDMQETLCCLDDSFVATATYMVKYKDWELWEYAREVTHWMPLPPPPKEERGE